MPKEGATKFLLEKQAEGMIIVCDVEPFIGKPVTYAPRHNKDTYPWRLNSIYRFGGNKCRAVQKNANG